MPNISSIGGGAHVPPEPNKAEGKNDPGWDPDFPPGWKPGWNPEWDGHKLVTFLQAQILQVQASLQNGDKTGAVKQIDFIIQQLGTTTPDNAALNDLLAAKSMIMSGGDPSFVNCYLNTAFIMLGPANLYMSAVQQIVTDINEGNRDGALGAINDLMNQVQNSGGAPSIVQGILNNLMAARSGVQGGAAPSAIMANLGDAYALLEELLCKKI